MQNQNGFDPFSYGEVGLPNEAQEAPTVEDMLFAPAEGAQPEEFSGTGAPSGTMEARSTAVANIGDDLFGAPNKPQRVGNSSVSRREVPRPRQTSTQARPGTRSGSRMPAATSPAARQERKSFATGEAPARQDDAMAKYVPPATGTKAAGPVALLLLLIGGVAGAFFLISMQNIPLASICGAIGLVAAAFTYTFLRE